jgi:stage V sporulation protein B
MSLFRIFTLSFFAEGIIVAVGFVNSIIITRALGVRGRGQYSLTMTLITVLSLVLGDGLCRAYTYLAGKDESNLRALFQNLIFYFGSMIVVLLFIPIAFASIFEKILPGLSNAFIVIAAITVPLLIVQRALNALMLGLRRYNYYNLFLVLPFLFYLLLNIYITRIGQVSAERVIVNYLYAVILACGIIFYIFIRREKLRFRFDRLMARESWDAGSKAAISHVSLFLLFRIDILLINLYLGVAAAGLYSIAVLLAELLQKMANTAGNVIFPQIAGNSNDAGKSLTGQVWKFITLFGLCFSALMIFIGRPLIVLLFKKEFAPAATALFWLLPGTIVMSGAKILNFSLWARGFPRITAIAPMIALISNVVLNIAMIPKLGIDGAAIATSISFIIYGVLLSTYYYYHYGQAELSPHSA